jgi:hypothetical protein
VASEESSVRSLSHSPPECTAGGICSRKSDAPNVNSQPIKTCQTCPISAHKDRKSSVLRFDSGLTSESHTRMSGPSGTVGVDFPPLEHRCGVGTFENLVATLSGMEERGLGTARLFLMSSSRRDFASYGKYVYRSPHRLGDQSKAGVLFIEENKHSSFSRRWGPQARRTGQCALLCDTQEGSGARLLTWKTALLTGLNMRKQSSLSACRSP